MSDDGYNPSGTGPQDDGAAGPAASLRLAIVSRTEEAAVALWDAMDQRSRSRNRPSRTRASRTDADVIVYLPVAEDFVSESAAQSLQSEIARDVASKKIVIEPGSVTARRVRKRMAHLRDRLKAQAGAIEWIEAAEHTSAEEPSKPRSDIARIQARQIQRLLRGERTSAEAASQPAVAEPEERRRGRKQRRESRSPERERKRAARREARAEGTRRSSRGRADETAAAPVKDRNQGAAEPAGTPKTKAAREARPNASTAPAKNLRERPLAPGDKPRPLPGVSVAILGMGDREKAALMESLRSAFRESGARAVLAKPQSMAHIAIHAFGDDPFESDDLDLRAHSLLENKALLRVFLGRANATDPERSAADDRAIAKISHTCKGAFVDLGAWLRRYQAQSPGPESVPGAGQTELTAALIAREAMNRNLRKMSWARKPLAPAPDLADALALASRPAELLSSLSWNAPSPPRLLHATFTQTEVENFANSTTAPATEDAREFSGQIDRQRPPEGRAALRLFGLRFLVAPLTYWYSKASERAGEKVAQIDAALKQQGITASAMLERAGETILDFSQKNPLQFGSQAWQEDPVSSRVRALLLYILCCKLAAKRRIRFEEEKCSAVFRILVDHIEFLRCDVPYPQGSIAGVERDSLLAGAGLALQQTTYGNVLLRDSLERLMKLQLGIGLSADGVWRNAPFATHCEVLSLLGTLVDDLATAKSDAIDPLADAVRRMTLFVDALLKSNGEPLPIDATKAKSYASTLSGARRMLARIGARPVKGKPAKGMAANRITETYVFRDAQYFVSHSTPTVTADSSQVAFHADAGSVAQKNPGGLRLAFAYGPTNLLLGTVPRGKKLTGLKPSSFDPALRNGYRVESGGAETRPSLPGGAGIVKSWRGPGWAAAKAIDSSWGPAGVTRIIVHLKAHHTLLVVDELSSAAGETVAFEQFWHIAPDLEPIEPSAIPMSFATGDGARLAMAIEDRHGTAVSIDRDRFSTCVRRRVRLAAGVTATFFQRMNALVLPTVSLLRDLPDDWIAEVSGQGIASRISLHANELRVIDEQKAGN